MDIVLDRLLLKARSVQSSSSTTRVVGRQTVVRLNPGDLTEEHVRALRKRFEPKVQPRVARIVKGKGKAVSLTEEDIPRLRQQWQQEFADIVNGTKEELPPWREVNHEINLIDNTKQYKYHLPRCPRALQDQLREKTNRYINAKWWEPRPAVQAAPLLCIPKKDGTLRTALDARQRNDNTVKDVTPLPDQEVIREDVAMAKYRSKIDLTDAYEQVHIREEDIPKTLFLSLMGTFVSNIMQIGDCNAPATFQRLMTSIF